MMHTKKVFFLSRLVCFNETFASLCGGLDYCMLWHEAIAGRNADDVTSSFITLLQKLSSSYQDIIIWADNCAAQNKNWTLFTALVQLVNADGPHRVTVKYLERGHTFMRCDSIHGQISKRLQRAKNVYTFDDLILIIRSSSTNILPIPMQVTEMRDWTSLRDPHAKVPLLKDIRIAKFERGSLNMLVKPRLDMDSFKICCFLAIERAPPFPQARQTERGVNRVKKQALLKTLLPLMPTVKSQFWRALPESTGTELNTFFG